MPDWIEDAAKKLKAEAERLKQEEECRRVMAATLLAQRPNIFGSLLAAVEKDVDLFAVHFPDAQEKLQKPIVIGDTKFEVLRAYSPIFDLDVTWDGNISIEWRISGERCIESGAFEMKYNDAGGGLYDGGTVISFEEASKKLIAPAIRGLAWKK